MERQKLVLKKAIKESDKNIIIFDIGGYFSRWIQKNIELSNKIKFIIEDTENGYQKYENLKTNIPILSVARSPLKDNEDNLVGESVVFSSDVLLRKMGEIIEYKKCGIIGYGKIGESIGKNLLQKGVKPIVYDQNAIKQIRALGNEIEFVKSNKPQTAIIKFIFNSEDIKKYEIIKKNFANQICYATEIKIDSSAITDSSSRKGFFILNTDDEKLKKIEGELRKEGINSIL